MTRHRSTEEAPPSDLAVPDARELTTGDAHVDAHRPPPGQLGTFAVLGAAAGTVPLPWVPDVIARRVRGALVQDVAARHGRGLSPGARALLSDPSGAKQRKSPVGQAFGYLGRKLLARFGPLAFLPPLRAALETYVLGYLFARYLSRARDDGDEARVEVSEARRVREAIDRAVVRVASPEGGLQWPTAPVAPDDARDEITQVLDGLLNATSMVPSWLLQRLDAAFDDELR